MNKIALCLLSVFFLMTASVKSSVFKKNDWQIDKIKLYKKQAKASYYHDKFNGRKTASGKRFYNNKLTAAHRKFPFGTKLKITNEKNRKSVIVEVTDRGPFIHNREIDLSKKAFMDIASNERSGLQNVKIEIVVIK
jgi:rare lipoprotein A